MSLRKKHAGVGVAKPAWSSLTLPLAALPALLALVALVVTLMVAFTAGPFGGAALAQQLDRPPNSLSNRQDVSDIWRAIRHGARMKRSDPLLPPQTAIQAEGQEWRTLRQQWVIPVGEGVLAVALAALALMALLRGRVRIHAGRSGRRIPRFSLFQRVAHWFAAVVFILLAISGLILLFGRPLLIPLMGKSAFSVLASAAKQGHNLFGPLFIVALAMLLPALARGNCPRWHDVVWWLKGGFLFRRNGPPAGRYNAGEKLWYWLLATFGVAIAISGVLLDFPFIAKELLWLQVSQLMHVISALVLIAYALGHIYLGTWGVEGALEAMTTGCVDENWAREHHPLWLERIEKGEEELPEACPTPVGQPVGEMQPGMQQEGGA